MDNDQHFGQLKDIVTMYLPEDVPNGAIGMDSNFIQELNINSANLVDIVLDVEDAFGIRLENEDMDRMQTIRDALNIITQKLKDKK
ncbi:MAG: phosphopantetheine-binding protein [Flavobacteriaceae bacterium]